MWTIKKTLIDASRHQRPETEVKGKLLWYRLPLHCFSTGVLPTANTSFGGREALLAELDMFTHWPLISAVHSHPVDSPHRAASRQVPR